MRMVLSPSGRNVNIDNFSTRSLDIDSICGTNEPVSIGDPTIYKSSNFAKSLVGKNNFTGRVLVASLDFSDTLTESG